MTSRLRQGLDSMLYGATKRLYKYALRKVLGDFLVFDGADFGVDQLDVDLRSGTVELRDLKLRPAVFDKFFDSTPFRAEIAHIDLVSIQLPMNFTSSNSSEEELASSEAALKDENSDDDADEISSSFAIKIRGVSLALVPRADGMGPYKEDVPKAFTSSSSAAQSSEDASNDSNELQDGLEYLSRRIWQALATLRLEVQTINLRLHHPLEPWKGAFLTVDRLESFAPDSNALKRRVLIRGLHAGIVEGDVRYSMIRGNPELDLVMDVEMKESLAALESVSAPALITGIHLHGSWLESRLSPRLINAAYDLVSYFSSTSTCEESHMRAMSQSMDETGSLDSDRFFDAVSAASLDQSALIRDTSTVSTPVLVSASSNAPRQDSVVSSVHQTPGYTNRFAFPITFKLHRFELNVFQDSLDKNHDEGVRWPLSDWLLERSEGENQHSSSKDVESNRTLETKQLEKLRHAMNSDTWSTTECLAYISSKFGLQVKRNDFMHQLGESQNFQYLEFGNAWRVLERAAIRESASEYDEDLWYNTIHAALRKLSKLSTAECLENIATQGLILRPHSFIAYMRTHSRFRETRDGEWYCLDDLPFVSWRVYGFVATRTSTGFLMKARSLALTHREYGLLLGSCAHRSPNVDMEARYIEATQDLSLRWSRESPLECFLLDASVMQELVDFVRGLQLKTSSSSSAKSGISTTPWSIRLLAESVLISRIRSETSEPLSLSLAEVEVLLSSTEPRLTLEWSSLVLGLEETMRSHLESIRQSSRPQGPQSDVVIISSDARSKVIIVPRGAVSEAVERGGNTSPTSITHAPHLAHSGQFLSHSPQKIRRTNENLVMAFADEDVEESDDNSEKTSAETSASMETKFNGFVSYGRATSAVFLRCQFASFSLPDMGEEIYQRIIAAAQGWSLKPVHVKDTDEATSRATHNWFALVSVAQGRVGFRSKDAFLTIDFADAELASSSEEDSFLQLRDFSVYEVKSSSHEQHRIPLLYTTKKRNLNERASVSEPKALWARSQRVFDSTEDEFTFNGRENGFNKYEIKSRVQLAGMTLRLDSGIDWVSIIARAAVPDGRNYDIHNVVWYTNARVTVSDSIIDFFPDALGSRAMLAIGRFKSWATLISTAEVQSWSHELLDAEVFIANPAPLRVPGEDAVEISYQGVRSPRSLIWATFTDFAFKNRLVRVASSRRVIIESRDKYVAEGLKMMLVESSHEISAQDVNVFTCADSGDALVEICSSLVSYFKQENCELSSVSPSKSPAVRESELQGSQRATPGKSELMAPRKSLSPLAASSSSVEAPGDTNRSARQMVLHYATAPDDALSATQLRARYSREVHLTPFVIDDYYSVGSLPMTEEQREEAKWLKNKHVSSPGTTGPVSSGKIDDDDWTLVEEEVLTISPLIQPKSSLAASKKATAAISVVSPPLNSTGSRSMATRATSPKRKSATNSYMEPATAPSHSMVSSTLAFRSLSHSVVLSAVAPRDELCPSWSTSARSGADDYVNDSVGEALQGLQVDEPNTSALVSSDDTTVELVEMKSLRVSRETTVQDDADDEAVDALKRSLFKVTQDLSEVADLAESEVIREALAYKSALFESRASLAMSQTNLSSSMSQSRVWHPGAPLIISEVEEQPDEIRPITPKAAPVTKDHDEFNDEPVSESPKQETMASSSIGTWFVPPETVRVYKHHVGVPNIAGPGSHLPSASALAAAMLLDESYPRTTTTSPRAAAVMLSPQSSELKRSNDNKFVFVRRIVVRGVDIRWRVFGGRDFPDVARRRRNELFEEQEDAAKVEVGEEQHATNPRVEMAGARTFRQVDRALELSLSDIQAFVEVKSTGLSLASFSVADFDVFDHSEASPYRRLFGFWIDEVQHPRETDAAMLRLAMDSVTTVDDPLAPTEHVRMVLSCMPCIVNVDQSILDLLTGFVESWTLKSKETSRLDTVTSTPRNSKVSVDVRATKAKIDFTPRGPISISELTKGSAKEIAKLFSYQGIEISLRRVRAELCTDISAALDICFESWAVDVSGSQMHKLLLGIGPLGAAAQLGQDLVNVVLLPMDMYRRGEEMQTIAKEAANRAGTFARTVVLQGLSAGAKVSGVVAGLADDELVEDSKRLEGASAHGRSKRSANHMGNVSSASEGLSYAARALTRSAAQTRRTIIAVPLSHYNQDGAMGLVKSFVRAVPIAVIQPIIVGAEALEATLIGLKRQIDPKTFAEEKRKFKD